MKKLIAILAATATLGVVSAFAQTADASKSSTSTSAKSNGQQAEHKHVDIGELSAVGDFRVASEDVYRGKKLAGFAVQPMLKLGYPVWEGELYTSMFFSLPVNEGPASIGGAATNGNLDGLWGTSNRDRADFTFGYSMPVTDMLSIDFGYTYHWYIQHNVYGVDRSNEIYLGATADVILDPSLYLYHDWDLEQFVAQFDVSYSFDLTQYTSDWGVGGTSIELGAHLGWLSADDYTAGQRLPVAAPGLAAGDLINKWINGYIYGGVKADIVFALNDVAKASIGMRWAGNNDGKDGIHPNAAAIAVAPGIASNYVPANQGQHESMFWWEAAVTFSF